MKSPQTKSFLFLVIILILLSGGVLFLANNSTIKLSNKKSEAKKEAKNAELQEGIIKIASKQQDPSLSDVSKWKEYIDDGLSLKFKYPPKWEVTTHEIEDPKYYVVVLSPGEGYDNIRIYVSKKNYFAADGLTKEKTKVAGQEGWTVQEMLYGVKAQSQYFTFDLGSNLELKPTFKNIIASVASN